MGLGVGSTKPPTLGSHNKPTFLRLGSPTHAYVHLSTLTWWVMSLAMRTSCLPSGYSGVLSVSIQATMPTSLSPAARSTSTYANQQRVIWCTHGRQQVALEHGPNTSADMGSTLPKRKGWQVRPYTGKRRSEDLRWCTYIRADTANAGCMFALASLGRIDTVAPNRRVILFPRCPALSDPPPAQYSTSPSLSLSRSLTSSKSSSCAAVQGPIAFPFPFFRTTSSRECSTVDGVEVTFSFCRR